MTERWAISVVACSLLLAATGAYAQSLPAGQDPDAPSLLEPVPSLPGVASRLDGLTFGMTMMGVHDSASGWYEVATPAIAFKATQHYSIDVSLPIYLHRLVQSSNTTYITVPGQNGRPPERVSTTMTTLSSHTWETADTVIAGHGTFFNRWMAYTVTPSVMLPTGDADQGTGTGRVTFDVDNHFEAPLWRSNLVVGIGGGDSSSLFNRLVTKDYTALGPLAHFQAGLLIPLSRRVSFESVAYEQLPLGDNKMYLTVSAPERPPQTVVSGTSVSEDNGFTNVLSLRLSPYVTVTGYYNRSLRLHLDDAGIGMTYVLRHARAGWQPSRPLINQLLRP